MSVLFIFHDLNFLQQIRLLQVKRSNIHRLAQRSLKLHWKPFYQMFKHSYTKWIQHEVASIHFCSLIHQRSTKKKNYLCLYLQFFAFVFLLLRRSKVQTQSKQTAIQSLTCRGRLGDLKQHCARLHVPDLEPGEVNAVNVFIWAAQIIWREDCDTDKTCEVEKSEGGENTTNIKTRPADKYAKILRYDDDTLNKKT